MAGRDKIKCYEYTPKGKYVQSYNSMQEVRDKYYSDIKGKYPLFTTSQIRKIVPFHALENGNYIFQSQVGRSYVKRLVRIRKSPLSLLGKIENKKVVMYNLLNEKIATFKNVQAASRITGINLSTIYTAVKHSKAERIQKDYYFQYKN